MNESLLLKRFLSSASWSVLYVIYNGDFYAITHTGAASNSGLWALKATYILQNAQNDLKYGAFALKEYAFCGATLS